MQVEQKEDSETKEGTSVPKKKVRLTWRWSPAAIWVGAAVVLLGGIATWRLINNK